MTSQNGLKLGGRIQRSVAGNGFLMSDIDSQSDID